MNKTYYDKNLMYSVVDANTIVMDANVSLWPNLYKYLLSDMTSKEISKEIQSKILLVSEEIYINIANYAYRNKDEKIGSVWIKTEKSETTYTITFSDCGEKYNPLQKQDPNISQSLQERQIGGLGIYLVKKLANKVSYVYEQLQNKLTITFNLY